MVRVGKVDKRMVCDGDEVMEAAAIKSWLLFNHRTLRRHRDDLFTVSVLTVALDGENDLEAICNKYRDRYGDDVAKDKIRSVVNKLVENGILDKSDDKYRVDGKRFEELQKSENEQREALDRVVRSVIEGAARLMGHDLDNREQYLVNIKKCLLYYFRTSCHAILGLDSKKEVNEIPQIEKILTQNIRKRSGELDVIIGEIGRALADDSNRELWNSLARNYMAAQIIGVDPSLKEFKTTVFASKVFVLDTDVVLNFLAKNSKLGQVYREMLLNLKKCGCTIYLPDEVVTEVFHHAEAAVARYSFVSELMNSDDEMVASLLNNVFVEDYYYLHRAKGTHCPAWGNYIGNFYNKKAGVQFTTDVLSDEFKGLVVFGLPDNVAIEEDEMTQLSDAVFEELTQTEKALRRGDELNRFMADTDARLFLTVGKLNILSKQRKSKVSNLSVLLKDDFYLLSASSRTFHISSEKGIGDGTNYICNPKALILILSEIGVAKDGGLNVMEVLDNPFITKVAATIEEDINNLNKLGFDFSSQNLVSLRYRLKDNIEEMMQSFDAGDYDRVSEIARNKDAKLRSNIQEIIDQRDKGLDEIERLRLENEKLKAENIRMSAQTNEERKERQKKKYEARRSIRKKLSGRKKK